MICTVFQNFYFVPFFVLFYFYVRNLISVNACGSNHVTLYVHVCVDACVGNISNVLPLNAYGNLLQAV